MALAFQCFTLTLLLGLGSHLGVDGEVFSSMATLRNLINNQATLLEGLEQYILKEEERLVQLKRLIEKKRDDVDQYFPDSEGAGRDVQHPTTAYTLIRDWSFISDKVYDTSSTNHLTFQAQGYSDQIPVLPDHGDRAGAQHALLRLQRVYNLSLDELAEGTVHGHPSHMVLDGRDFYDIGLAALNLGYYGTASQWLEAALSHPSDDLNEGYLLYWIGQSYSRTQQWGKAARFLGMASELDPYNETLLQQFVSINQTATLYGDLSTYPYTEYYPDWKIKYEAQCRQEIPSPHRNLWCEYQTHHVHYAPYKVEVMNQDPWVIMYHDVIGDWEVETIKELATPELNRAVVGDPAKAYATEERISKVAWLWDQLGDPFIQHLSKRVEQVTGLITKYHEEYSNSEPFQVVNYGMGGQYEPHVDVYENHQHLENLPAFLQGTGDRVATFMFYLSDVKEGGATVFPLIDVYVPPKKKSAAFWYNIHRNGTLDLRTQHAGCPVLVGEKWVANKWIREFGQVFRRPCGPTPTSTEMESRNAAAGL